MLDITQSLLLVYGECGPEVSDQEFNGTFAINYMLYHYFNHLHTTDWYDNEHAPLRLTVPGITTATRYKAVDAQKPSYLALYDMSSPAVMTGSEYTSLHLKASANEVDIISRLQSLDRRVYTLISSLTLPNTTPEMLPGRYMFVVFMEVTPEGEAEFNKWYEEEHMVLVAKTPGWLRGRRYKVVEQTELAGKGDKEAAAKKPKTYLALHELSRDDFKDQEAFKTAISTPWRAKVSENVFDKELRLFERLKVFDRPE